MKYLRKFATEADASVVAKPNVVLFADTKEVRFNFAKLGVFIQHISGNLFTTEQWSANGFSNNDANGVAVIANEASFVIAKELYSDVKYGAYDAQLTDIAYPATAEEAALDLDGLGNTQKLVEQLKDYTDTNYKITGAPIAEACANYTFPNGAKGYLPSVGELVIMGRYANAIQTALSQIGGDAFYSANYASSTQKTKQVFWAFWWGTKQPSEAGKAYAHPYRPFGVLNI